MRSQVAAGVRCAIAAWLIALLPAAALAETLAYWRFEDHPVGGKLDAERGVTTPPFTTTEDSSGNGNALRTYNTRRTLFPPDTSGTFISIDRLPRLSGGVSNTRGVRFTGRQDFYTFDNDETPPPVASAPLRQFTVEGFFRLSALSRRIQNRYQVIVGKDGKPVDRLPFQPFVVVVGGRDDEYGARDCLRVHIIDSTGEYRTAASPTPLQANAWYAFAATCDGEVLRLYLNRFDGKGYQLEGESSVQGGLMNSIGQWVIGRGMLNYEANSWLYGDVDEVRISNEVLEPASWLAADLRELAEPPVEAPVEVVKPQLAVRGLADPSVLLHDGVYYLYGTTDTTSFTVFTSLDLKTWERGPKILSAGEGVWGDSAFWAPGILHHKGRFYLYYSASGELPHSGGRRSVRIGVAVADSPTGPFKEVVPRMPLLGRAVIDPEPFIDDDGTPYLFFVADIPENNGSGQIYVVRLSDDLLSPVDEPVLCIEPSQAWEGSTWNEGPYVFRDGDTYVMMYSGDFWASPNYSVGVATAPTPYGPWDKRDDNPFLRRYAGLRGTGHNSMVRAPDGKGWLTFFHAHPSPDRTEPRDTYFTRLVIDRDARGEVRLRAEPWLGGGDE